MKLSTEKKSRPQELKLPSCAKTAETLELLELGKKARIVFHDLSNHLTALTLSVGRLEENLARDTERLKEYSRYSEKTRTQMEYIANLLRSHLETAKNTVFDPSTEIKQTVAAFSDQALVSEIKIECKTDKSIQLFGNKLVFGHIVTNLLSNALQAFVSDESFTPHKNQHQPLERRIQIELRKNHSEIFLSISDTGCGIAAADLDKIFESKFTTKQNGHGIGLFATKEFVEQNFKGTIRVTSSTDVSCHGTTFTITFPKQNRKRHALPVLLERNFSLT